MHDLSETHQIGANTREWMVGMDTCQPLASYYIRLTGVSDARYGFSFVRNKPEISQILACISGWGEVLIEGEWKPCRAGEAYLTPAGQLHAYRAVADHDWGVCWISYDERPGNPVSLATARPVLAAYDPRPLHDAIQGLYRESVGPNDPALIHHWTGLIHLLGLRAARPYSTDERLWRLWEKIDANLGHPWNLSELAGLAGMSGEHLRRLCQKQLGHSPLEHVTWLRMRRAASLLSGSERRIDAIASAVGYENAFAFSTAFKRHMKSTPSTYRRAGG
jgi:AraC-like DNA-binding protein